VKGRLLPPGREKNGWGVARWLGKEKLTKKKVLGRRAMWEEGSRGASKDQIRSKHHDRVREEKPNAYYVWINFGPKERMRGKVTA